MGTACLPQIEIKRKGRTNSTMHDRKRVLVTGGAGFLGSHLCERLLKEGCDVICMDNFRTSAKRNIRHLLESPYFEFIRHDIIEPIFIECDQIYNLACPASPIWYQEDPIYTTITSIYGAFNTLGIAKRVGARILQSSTSEVYGDPEVHPQVESYRGAVNTIGPRACYDEGKRVAETLFFDYHRQHGVDIKVMRIFNTYGPRKDMGDGRVGSNFIVQALKGEDNTIYGDGSQTRSFCYVDDLIDGMYKLMNESREDFTGPVNIGNPGEFTIKELAEKVISMTGSSSNIVYKDLPVDDPTQRKPDITLAKEELGWSPKVNLDEGLEKTIAYFQERLEKLQKAGVEV